MDTAGLTIGRIAASSAARVRLYGTPSDQRADAFRVDRVLDETEDLTTWSQLYTAWRLVGPSPAA